MNRSKTVLKRNNKRYKGEICKNITNTLEKFNCYEKRLSEFIKVFIFILEKLKKKTKNPDLTSIYMKLGTNNTERNAFIRVNIKILKDTITFLENPLTLQIIKKAYPSKNINTIKKNCTQGIQNLEAIYNHNSGGRTDLEPMPDVPTLEPMPDAPTHVPKMKSHRTAILSGKKHKGKSSRKHNKKSSRKHKGKSSRKHNKKSSRKT